MRTMLFVLATLIFWSPIPAQAEGKMEIVKVLKHLLDQDGKHTLSPSLLDRDAYQAHLREHSELVSGIRFDIQLRAKPKSADALRLKVEIRHGEGNTIKTLSKESAIPNKKRRRSFWQGLKVSGAEYQQLGGIIAWRVSLWQGDTKMSELESFLW